MHKQTIARRAGGLLLAASLGLGCASQEVSALPAQGALMGPFPGAGTSGAGQSIAAGVGTVSCGSNGSAFSSGPAPGAQAHQTCFYDPTTPAYPAATVEWIVETAQDSDVVHVRLTLNPSFCDNSYGANAVGWNAAPPPAAGAKPGHPGPMGHGGHAFKDLVGSDHAEFKLSDASGRLVLRFKQDYLSPSAGTPSGYASLGVSGGDGKMLLGDAADVVAFSTSLERNLNACGLAGYTVDSPATDAYYTPNPSASDWDYRVVYDVWVRAAVFGAAGFGDARVDYVHASPSKGDNNTVTVTPGKCPPDWPPYCTDPDACNRCNGSECNPPATPDAGLVHLI